MKEIFKSKVMVAFMLFIIGTCVINAFEIKNEAQKNVSAGTTNSQIITKNNSSINYHK